MKTFLLTSAAALFVLSSGSFASAPATDFGVGKATSTIEDTEARRRPRVPGGSGCDTARDRAEHPECRVARRGADDPAGHVRGEGPGHASVINLNDLQQLARSKPRVPGGSGCDTTRDRAEHPECRV
jgi:hypothetical protein